MKNSEEVNKYYKLINEYIDIYLDNWKISPKKLKRYLSSERISNFLEKKGLKEIKNIEKDYESQSEAYNYLFESLNKTNNISRINAANFTWDDALDPEVRPRISISASFRNKPAEQIIKAWYNK